MGTRSHAARVESSPRLQRVLSALRGARDAGRRGLGFMEWLSTRDIMQTAFVMAVNSCVSELRENGYGIECKREGKFFMYRLVSEPQKEGVHDAGSHARGQ